MMHHLDIEMKECIDSCLDCYSNCLGMAMGTVSKPVANTSRPRIFV